MQDISPARGFKIGIKYIHMGPIAQYLRETRAELRHVAWPTQSQTIVYTILVAAISIFVAAYLGFFDFLFTSGLAKLIEVVPVQSPVTISQIATSTATTTSATTSHQ